MLNLLKIPTLVWEFNLILFLLNLGSIFLILQKSYLRNLFDSVSKLELSCLNVLLNGLNASR
jgi:hypothetical protein